MIAKTCEAASIGGLVNTAHCFFTSGRRKQYDCQSVRHAPSPLTPICPFSMRVASKMFAPSSFDETSQWQAIIRYGDGHVGNGAMTIPDYFAIGLLLMVPLAAARWFAQRKFELFPTGSDPQRRSPMPKL